MFCECVIESPSQSLSGKVASDKEPSPLFALCGNSGSTGEDESQSADPGPLKAAPAQPAPSQEPDSNGGSRDQKNFWLMKNHWTLSLMFSSLSGGSKCQDDFVMLDGEISSQVESLKQCLVDRTERYGVTELESLYTRIKKGVIETKPMAGEDHKA
ncbi:hypothetical protein NE237_013817 [Protea cynaroides]|uniref:Uncharacterized protein n=1 Tax=Protea cynaroides TaxID=273540 RepID=A0A9Q0JY83_9MAGN|nr:hypothetical protein NE237_013817 [Protea cynaroides]